MSTFKPKPGKHKPKFRIKQLTIGESKSITTINK